MPNKRRRRRRRKPDSPIHRLYLKRGVWYADLRDVGGGQKSMDTADEVEADRRCRDMFAELKSRPADREVDPLLREYAERHLRLKAEVKRAETVARDERSLRAILASETFGPDVRLSEITRRMVSDYIVERRAAVSRRGSKFRPQTLLHELNALSNLFKRAMHDELVELNPIAQHMDKPIVKRNEAVYLESGEAVRFLEAARSVDAFWHAVFTTFLYTGGRSGEVRGLLVKDVDFQSNRVHFRPNVYRPYLKTEDSNRSVRLWPDLAGVINAYLDRTAGRDDPDALLFPSPGRQMLNGDFRHWVARIVRQMNREAEPRGIAPLAKRITPHGFRHTFTAARIQMIDNGQPVSLYTVARELGHGNTKLVEQTYGHVPEERHRSSVLTYREAGVLNLPNREARA